MAILRRLRNHWKKSVFGAFFLTFGSRWSLKKYRDAEYLRQICEEARQYGDMPLPVTAQPRHVTVVLNPAANHGKSVAMFERLCAPLLHLAGLKVAVVRTERPGETAQLLAMMDNTDAVIVAGGNGTVIEAVSGIMRRSSGSSQNTISGSSSSSASAATANCLPLAIVPLGASNWAAGRLWGHAGDPVRQVTAATMAVIRQQTARWPVMKVMPLPDQDSDGSAGGDSGAGLDAARAVYGLCELRWGAVRDAVSRASRYWYWGRWQQHAAFLFTAVKNTGVCWRCTAELDYTPACAGCCRCVNSKTWRSVEPAGLSRTATAAGSWWTRWLRWSRGAVKETSSADDVRWRRMMSVENTQCGSIEHVCVATSDFRLNIDQQSTADSDRDRDGHRDGDSDSDSGSDRGGGSDSVLVDSDNTANATGLSISIGPANTTLRQFVSSGWDSVSSAHTLYPGSQLVARADTVTLTPITAQPLKEQEVGDQWVSIDGEPFELKRMHVQYLPEALCVFVNQPAGADIAT